MEEEFIVEITEQVKVRIDKVTNRTYIVFDDRYDNLLLGFTIDELIAEGFKVTRLDDIVDVIVKCTVCNTEYTGEKSLSKWYTCGQCHSNKHIIITPLDKVKEGHNGHFKQE